MAKRHTKQNSKQSLGQYFTTNADTILSGFEHCVFGKDVVDPFSGDWDLLRWASKNGAASISGYDLEPKNSETEQRDSLKNPSSYVGKLVITNPPYLAANKSKGAYKEIFEKWKQSDLYKCFLASLSRLGASEAIVIIPSNFFCESNAKARDSLFSDYDVVYAKYWREQVFDDATTGVCAIHLKSREGFNYGKQQFECLVLPENKKISMHLEREYGYIHGGNEVALLDRSYHFEKIEDDKTIPNTKIVIGCLDHGKYKLGFHYNNENTIITPKTVITTFQVNSVDFILTDEQQKAIISVANQNLSSFREKYDSMFLSNYMGATQKIMSVNIARAFLSDATKKVLTSS
jgi:hypothetical protein